MRTSAIVAMIVGLGMTAAPEIVYPDGGAAFAQGKSGERGNSGNRGRSGRDDDTSFAARGNSGNNGNRGGKSGDWVPPGQAKWDGDNEFARGGKAKGKWDEDGEFTRGGKANGRLAKSEDLEEIDGVETELEDTARGRGSIASALGALNAAHANENALANASPNSRVGRIAAYRDEVLNGQAAEEELEAAQTLLESLDEPDRNLREVRRDLRDVRSQIEELNQQIAEAEGDTTELENQRRELIDEGRDLLGEFRDARDYRDAERAVEELSEEVETSEELQMDLLEAAANKEVTDEVVVEVNRLLGIEEIEEIEEIEALVDDTGEDEILLLPEES